MYIYIYYLAGIKLKEDQQPTAQSTITKMQQQNATTATTAHLTASMSQKKYLLVLPSLEPPQPIADSLTIDLSAHPENCPILYMGSLATYLGSTIPTL
jgi:hypothetical protein